MVPAWVPKAWSKKVRHGAIKWYLKGLPVIYLIRPVQRRNLSRGGQGQRLLFLHTTTVALHRPLPPHFLHPPPLSQRLHHPSPACPSASLIHQCSKLWFRYDCHSVQFQKIVFYNRGRVSCVWCTQSGKYQSEFYRPISLNANSHSPTTRNLVHFQNKIFQGYQI